MKNLPGLVWDAQKYEDLQQLLMLSISKGERTHLSFFYTRNLDSCPQLQEKCSWRQLHMNIHRSMHHNDRHGEFWLNVLATSFPRDKRTSLHINHGRNLLSETVS